MAGKMKKRWIALYTENEIGVLSKVSGLFSAKSYNLNSLTVGTTEHPDISRMTISVESDDVTFEQIKKQFNSMVEIIKVIDLTNVPIHMKEVLFAKIKQIGPEEKAEVFRIAETFGVKPVDIGLDAIILESTLTERKNDELVSILRKSFKHIDVTRGGAVAVEGISTSCR